MDKNYFYSIIDFSKLVSTALVLPVQCTTVHLPCHPARAVGSAIWLGITVNGLITASKPEIGGALVSGHERRIICSDGAS